MAEEGKNDAPPKGTDLFAFVLMPFRPEFDDIYRLGVKETAAECGILAERVDEQLYRENILERIYRQIDTADLIVADMSGQNPNVFYEVGYAHAKGKLCILTTQKKSDIPFDLQLRRHVIYDGSILKLKEKLREELLWARTEIARLRSCGIEVNLSETTPELERTGMLDFGTVGFQYDLIGRHHDAPTELHAIYFYTGSVWHLTQDEKECPTTDSDIPEFKARHMLTSSVTRFREGTWAQIKFKARKVLASKIRGQELKDSYRCHGKVLLRLVTAEGSFDYPFLVDVEVAQFPF